LYPVRIQEVSKPDQDFTKDYEREHLLKLKMQQTVNNLLKIEAS